jgi:hypothetical protein
VLINERIVTEEQPTEAYGIATLDLVGYPIDPATVTKIPMAMALRHRALNDHEITVGITDPGDALALDDVRAATASRSARWSLHGPRCVVLIDGIRDPLLRSRYRCTSNGRVSTTTEVSKKPIFGTTTSGTAATGGRSQAAMLSPGNSMQYKRATDGAGYKVCGTNADGKAFHIYDGAVGGSVKKVEGEPRSRAASPDRTHLHRERTPP